MTTIPKYIHYCWFGDQQLGDKELKCIHSWKLYFPEFEIIEWNEENFDIHSCMYVEEAYRAKKWAFVSDYARFEILYKYGGLYFDTDVEVINPMDDIVAAGPYLGFETDVSGYGNNDHMNYSDQSGTVAPGLGMGAYPKMAIFREFIDSYRDQHFITSDGSPDTTTVVRRTTQILQKHGLSDRPGIQSVAGVSIYPSEYFNPKDRYTGELLISDKTKSIHHYGKSWLSSRELYEHNVVSWLMRHNVRGKKAFIIATGISALRHGDINKIVNGIRKYI